MTASASSPTRRRTPPPSGSLAALTGRLHEAPGQRRPISGRHRVPQAGARGRYGRSGPGATRASPPQRPVGGRHGARAVRRTNPAGAAHAAQMAIEPARLHQPGQGELVECRRAAVAPVLLLGDPRPQVPRSQHPPQSDRGSERLADRSNTHDAIRREALERSDRLLVVAELRVVVVLDHHPAHLLGPLASYAAWSIVSRTVPATSSSRSWSARSSAASTGTYTYPACPPPSNARSLWRGQQRSLTMIGPPPKFHGLRDNLPAQPCRSISCSWTYTFLPMFFPPADGCFPRCPPAAVAVLSSSDLG